jgi:hypothetical protein
MATDAFPLSVPQLSWTFIGPTGAPWQPGTGGAPQSGFMEIGAGVGSTQHTNMQCNSDIGSANMDVSAQLTLDRAAIGFGTTCASEVCARAPGNGSLTWYEARVIFDNVDATILLRRRIANVTTELAQWNVGQWDTNGRTLHLRVSGTNPVRLEPMTGVTSLGLFFDSDAARIQTGNFSAIGMRGTTAAVARIDNFSAIQFTPASTPVTFAGKVSIVTNARQGLVLRQR